MAVNFSKKIEKSAFTNQLEFKQNSRELPQHPARILLLGPSGCGKTNLLLNFLLDSPYKLNYTRLYLFAKDINEPAYEYLRSELDEKEEKLVKYAKKHNITMPDDFSLYYTADNLQDVPDVNTLDKSEQNIIVFDDFAIDRDQSIIKEYFIRARKQNCTLIYLSQTFKATPKEIRDQIGYVALFKPSGGYEIRNLAQNYAAELDSKQFKALINSTTRKKGDFLFIDINEGDKSKKYKYKLDKKTKWEE
jgi:energy-coupling factor transporter ATP-binding protein EcfA2